MCDISSPECTTGSGSSSSGKTNAKMDIKDPLIVLFGYVGRR